MIESDGTSYEMWKMGKGIFKFMILIWLIIMPIVVMFLSEFSWEFFKIYTIVLFIFLLYRYFVKKIKSQLYLAKMNEEIVIFKSDGNDSINFSWDEISAISRLRFTNPALYITTTKKSDNNVYIFPTSAHLLTFSFSINGLGIQRDFSKMGKHIRKIKREKNIESFYTFFLKELIKKHRNVC